MPAFLAGLAAVTAGGLVDEILGRHLPLLLRLPLFAGIGLFVFLRVRPFIKQLREDVGR